MQPALSTRPIRRLSYQGGRTRGARPSFPLPGPIEPGLILVAALDCTPGYRTAPCASRCPSPDSDDCREFVRSRHAGEAAANDNSSALGSCPWGLFPSWTPSDHAVRDSKNPAATIETPPTPQTTSGRPGRRNAEHWLAAH